MSDIIYIIQSIGNFFSSVGDFIVGFFQDTVNFLDYLTTTVPNFFSSLFSGFPVFFISGVLGLITILVLIRILGRD